MNVDHGTIKPFQYDTPDRRRTRLFQLDLNGENEPLSGKLISFIDTNVALGNFDLRGYFKSIPEGYWLVLEKLSGSDGYDALSWVWGEAENEQLLYLTAIGPSLDENEDVDLDQGRNRNGFICIRPSLYEFLKEYRRKQCKRFLWIDAICLDQANDEDKRIHIPGLRQTYENADSVLYWLGVGNPLMTNALSQIEPVTQELGRCANDSVELWKFPSWERFNIPPRDSDFWKGMRDLLTNKWWSRLWTLQEAVATKEESKGVDAKDVRLFLCGDRTIPWSTVENFTTAAVKCHIEDWLIAENWFVEVDDKHAFDAMDEIRGCRENYTWGSRLNAALLATMRRKATTPVEMVLGQTALIDRSEAEKLNITFALSKEIVFVEFAKYYIRQEPFECLLNHIATKERCAELPSWCPNFASSKETLSIGSFWFGDSTPEDPTMDEQFYHAGYNNNLFSRYTVPHSQTFGMIFKITGNMARGKSPYVNLYASNNKRQMKAMDDTNFLRLSGMEVDTVDQIIDCNPAADSNDFLSYASLCETSKWLTKCLNLAMSTKPGGSQAIQNATGFNLFVRTITANRIVIRPEPGKDIIFDRKEETDFIERYAKFMSFLNAAMQAEQAIDGSNMEESTLDFMHVLRCVTRRRRFFATVGGRIGIGPSNTEPGDQIRVVFFCSTPFLMRQASEGRSRLIGETYVHGLMYGEAIDMFRDKHLKETQWTLE
ncbi:heterokaryon incompatibility protein-domain-containing protein [Xylariaceae sp. AK1471]|nr:heterokaryon incompatibility protein-domain-containing protein [Xylariaceae sp. AK1471]